MIRNNKKIKMSYELETDVLRIHTSSELIDYAAEIGNVIVHFNRKAFRFILRFLRQNNF